MNKGIDVCLLYYLLSKELNHSLLDILLFGETCHITTITVWWLALFP
jgi:hypothetical protein